MYNSFLSGISELETNTGHPHNFRSLELYSMDQVRMGDDDSGSHPTESSATPLIQAEPSLLTSTGSESNAEDPAWPSPPPSTGDFHYTDKSWFSSPQSLHPKLTDLRFGLPRSKPLFTGFEKPSFSRIAILTVLCLIAYPVFYTVTLVAKDKSLFVVRLIVNVWCSGGGLALGYVLLKIGARHLEAASEYTFVGYRDILSLYSKQPGRR